MPPGPGASDWTWPRAPRNRGQGVIPLAVGPALLFSDAEFRTFLEGVKDGDFDDVLGCRG